MSLSYKCPIMRAVSSFAKQVPGLGIAGNGQPQVQIQIIQHDHHEWVRGGSTGMIDVGNIVDVNAGDALYYCRFCLARATEVEYVQAVAEAMAAQS